MLKRNILWISAIVVAAAGWSNARAEAPRGACDDSLTASIPARAVGSLGGRAFAEHIRGLDDEEREANIKHELLTGNIPEFLRHLKPVRLHSNPAGDRGVDVVVCVAPDYLAVGSDDDFLLMPMRLGTALSVASSYGFTLPTPRMVDAIYAQAEARLVPEPLAASDQMRSTEYSLIHNEMVGRQRALRGVSPGTLISGDKKDLVLTNRLWSHIDRVAIYGWHLPTVKPIQSLSTVHGWRYADYSHGARLISARIWVDGKLTSIFDALQDPRLAATLSGEGIITNVNGLIANLSARRQTVIASALRGTPGRFP